MDILPDKSLFSSALHCCACAYIHVHISRVSELVGHKWPSRPKGNYLLFSQQNNTLFVFILYGLGIYGVPKTNTCIHYVHTH